MKKSFFILFLALIFVPQSSMATDIPCPWQNCTVEQREELIDRYRKEIQQEPNVDISRKTLESLYGDYTRDKDYKEHMSGKSTGKYRTIMKKQKVYAAEWTHGGVKSYNQDMIVGYVLLDTTNNIGLMYNSAGALTYIEIYSSAYPGTPYIVRRFQKNGTLNLTTYYIAPKNAFLYQPEGGFRGYWDKGTIFDKKNRNTYSSIIY